MTNQGDAIYSMKERERERESAFTCGISDMRFECIVSCCNTGNSPYRATISEVGFHATSANFLHGGNGQVLF